MKDRVLEFLAVRQLRDQADKAEKARESEKYDEAGGSVKSEKVAPAPTTVNVEDKRRQGPHPALRRAARRRQDPA